MDDYEERPNKGPPDAHEQLCQAALEVDKDRLKWIIRRRMAIASFAALLCCGVYYSAIGLFITMDQAKTMAEFNSIVVTIVGALISLLLGYFGTSYLFDKDKLR